MRTLLRNENIQVQLFNHPRYRAVTPNQQPNPNTKSQNTTLEHNGPIRHWNTKQALIQGKERQV